MIDEISLSNFKAWKDSKPVELAPVTMLLGTNSSGKSTLLQSLLLLKQTAASPDRSIHLNLGGDEINDLFNFGDFDTVIYQGAKAPLHFEITFKFHKPAEASNPSGAFCCSYGKTSGGSVAIQALSLASDKKVFRALRRERGAYSIVVDDETQPRAKGRHLAPERSIAFSADAIALLGPEGVELQDLSLAIRRELESIVYLGPLRRKPERDYVWNKGKPGEIGSDGHKVIDALLANSLIKSEDQHSVLEGVAYWLKKMGMAEDVFVQQVGRSSRYELVILRKGVYANLRDVGIGVSQVLPVLTVAYFVPPGTTILLEEPEIHLHPLAQSILAEMFVEVSRKRKVQFIVETHSEHLFRRMQTLIAKQKTSPEQCRMYFIESRKDTALIKKLDVDEFGAVKNWPEHFFGDSVGEAREQAKARGERLRRGAHG